MSQHPPRTRLSPHPWGAGGAILLALFLLFCLTSPASAATKRNPRVVLILVPNTPSEPFLQALGKPEYRQLAAGSGLALMNAVVPGLPTPESANLTLGAGQRLQCPADLPLAGPTSLFTGPGGPLEGRPVYAWGYRPVAMEACQPGFDQLSRARGYPPDALPGALAAACGKAEKRVGYLGLYAPDRHFTGRGFLAAAGPEGFTTADGFKDAPAQPAEWARMAEERFPPDVQDVLVVDLPPGSTPDYALGAAEAFTRTLDPARDLLVVTSPDPGEPARGMWQFLSPVLLWGDAWKGQVATSSTTRTRGLLANIDLAPTLLQHLGVPVPEAMGGHSAESAGAGSREELLAFAAHARSTRAFMLPGLLAWGLTALAAFLWATYLLFAALRRPGPFRVARWVGLGSRALLAAVTASPCAFLLAGAWPAGSPGELAVRLALITGGLTLAAMLVRRWMSPVVATLIPLALVLVADLYLPTEMLSRNLMSDFPNIGARFYGIGNEYEGCIIGVAVLLPFCIAHYLGHTRITPAARWLTGLFWLVVLVAVAAPRYGADFGGALSFALGAMLAGGIFAAEKLDRRTVLRRLALGAVLAVGMAVLCVAVDLARPPGSRTHVGELAAKALQGSWAPVIDLAMRKAQLNVHMALTPFFLFGLAAVTPFLWLWYSKLGSAAWAALSSRPLLKSGVLSVFGAAVVTLFLNDTGVIAWALATCGALLLWLDLLLEDRILGNPA